MNIVSYFADPTAGVAGSHELENTTAISAIFTDQGSAGAAVRELREIGIPAEDISLISRKEEPPRDTGLPDDPGMEELPAVEPEPAVRPTPVFIDVDVPPDEPLGGSDRLGLTRDREEARYHEDYPNA